MAKSHRDYLGSSVGIVVLAVKRHLRIKQHHRVKIIYTEQLVQPDRLDRLNLSLSSLHSTETGAISVAWECNCDSRGLLHRSRYTAGDQFDDISGYWNIGGNRRRIYGRFSYVHQTSFVVL